MAWVQSLCIHFGPFNTWCIQFNLIELENTYKVKEKQNIDDFLHFFILFKVNLRLKLGEKF
jgi:hypothetical protein